MQIAKTFVLFLACAGGALADGDRGREEHGIEELMERTHEGRRSPYRRLGQIVKGEGVAWPEVDRIVLEFDPMCRALLASKNDEIKGSADGYVDAVKEIWAAAKKRDAEGVRAGYATLQNSCGDCHSKGGVGGELDD